MELNIKDIKNLREETGAGVLEVKQALENFAGDYTKAKEELMKKVGAKAAKSQNRGFSEVVQGSGYAGRNG
ncbi:MAG: Elongation factor Ts [candidate division WWE3 bacterium GW2011_GWA2_42_9]|nr:MAG: Elongation factor Ts [candidate division WWE3 bacterium GW2011_GWA2_42_9]